ncbi:hypothetical protein GGS21DRAFT_507703 [Xylaria nigripes]|nr:hypothetical protein GGS21DRAFT_507703 [Xylaria nigripes]
MGLSLFSSWRSGSQAMLNISQFVISLVVIGLYAGDLQHPPSDLEVDSKWVYAISVASVSAITSLVYLSTHILRYKLMPVWSFIIFVLWITVFGMYGSTFLHQNANGNDDIKRMKNAVWVDLTMTLLWVADVAFLAFCLWFLDERATRFTGRGKV